MHHAIEQFDGCTPEEKEALYRELRELEAMATKLQSGRVEIVLFGEIDTGKSALINALVGQSIAQVDVRGGWTRDVWHVAWQGSGYCLPGLADSQVVLIDTPGINEVEGAARGEMARDAAARADLILFVTDSDLNQLEYSALLELAGSHKPILLVFNKTDNYTPEARRTLLETFASRLHGVVAAEDIIETTADPLPREYVIEAADGREQSEYRRPAPNVGRLKERILEILAREGKAIVALNGALYAADKSDRIATIKMQMRDERATATIWSYAAMKAVAVAVTPVPALDVLGGSAVDVTMVVTLAHVYGIPLTWVNARQLIESIVKAAGWVMVMEAATHLAAEHLRRPDARHGQDPHGPAARCRRRLRLVHRRAGGQILFRAWRFVGRRSTQDRRHPHPGRHRQAVGPRALASRDSPQARRQSPQRAKRTAGKRRSRRLNCVRPPPVEQTRPP